MKRLPIFLLSMMWNKTRQYYHNTRKCIYWSLGKTHLPDFIVAKSSFAYSKIKIVVPTSIPSHPCRSDNLTNSDVSWEILIKPFALRVMPYGANVMPSLLRLSSRSKYWNHWTISGTSMLDVKDCSESSEDEGCCGNM